MKLRARLGADDAIAPALLGLIERRVGESDELFRAARLILKK
jgi:hypothetical protein